MSRGAASLPGRKGAPLFLQVLALVLVSVVAAQAINLWIVFHAPTPAPNMYRLGDVVAALQAGGAPVRARNGKILVAREQPAPVARESFTGRERLPRGLAFELARRLGVNPSQVRLTLVLNPHSPIRQTIRQMHDQLGDDSPTAAGPRFIVGPFEAGLQKPDGKWLVVEPEKPTALSPWETRIFVWFAITAVALAPVAYLFARRLAGPIAAFAAAAERLGRDPNAAPLTLHGSSEVQVAVTAFNDMQDRLRRYVDDRSAMLAAVAHDLRTPLTRLRFRVENAPEGMRGKMIADIEQMDAMIAATMAFVRDATQKAERRPLELSSLVQSIADEMADTGADVSAEAVSPVVIDGDPVALRRLVSNLLDNAVKFGASARARVYAQDSSAVIEVDDEGPGVPESDRERVFEPFYRREPSRSRQTGGAGLGLAVVRSVARAHGGDAVLENRPSGGLRATARLPL